MAKRIWFKFYDSYLEAINSLPLADDRANCFKAIAEYALSGIIPETGTIAFALLAMCKANIDKQAAAYDRIVIRNKSNISKRWSEKIPDDTSAIPDDTRAQEDKKIRRSEDKKIKYTEEFEQFWKTYPKKVGKEKAFPVFEEVLSRATVEQLIQAVEKQKLSAEWTKENGTFIPHPVTWLRRGGWEDELTYPEGTFRKKKKFIGTEFLEDGTATKGYWVDDEAEY